MSIIDYSRSQRFQAYRDLIADCHDRANLPDLLVKAAKLYGALKVKDLTRILAESYNHRVR